MPPRRADTRAAAEAAQATVAAIAEMLTPAQRAALALLTDEPRLPSPAGEETTGLAVLRLAWKQDRETPHGWRISYLGKLVLRFLAETPPDAG